MKDIITSNRTNGLIVFTFEGKSYIVKRVHFTADVKSKQLPIEMVMQPIERRTKFVKDVIMQASVPANLVHDLIEWTQMERTDTVTIKVEGGDVVWDFIPEEQWKQMLERAKAPKERP